jgi:hypothetical protein
LIVGQQRHSGLGIASFIVSLGSAGMVFIMFVIAGYLEMSTPGGVDENSPTVALVGLGILGFMATALVGAGLGIGGLFQRDRLQLFSILGIVLGGVTLIGTIGLIGLGLSMQ